MNNYFTPFSKVKNIWIIYFLYIFILILFWFYQSSKEIHLFPTIYQVKEALIYLFNKGLVLELFSSIFLCLKALIIGVFISCCIVYLTSIPIIKPLAVFLSKFRFLPLSGIAYYLSLVTSSGSSTQIFVLVMSLVFSTVTSLMGVIADIKEAEYDHVKSLGMTKWQIIKELIIFSRLDYLVEVIRVNFSITWFMLVMVESMIRSNGGIGVLIQDAEHLGKHENIITLQIVLLFVGIFIDYVFTQFRKIFFLYTDF
jgi:NitT/TauT family transport system permease protein